jgi:microcystin-dependent protein
MVWRFSKTAATNASADGTINFAEGQVPGSLNDSARALMARVAQYRDDISGALVTTGTGTAYAVSSNQIFDTLAHMDVAMVAFTPNVTNTGTITLNVDGLGAKPLRSAPSVELPSGSLILGTPYLATYYNTAGEWILQGAALSNPYQIPLGAGIDYWGSTTPNSAFVFPYGQAISRTTYATLFAKFNITYGAGDGSTTFNLPNKKSRLSMCPDAMGDGNPLGVMPGVVLGSTGGLVSASTSLSAANLPPHAHTGTGTTGDDYPDHTHNALGAYTFNASTGSGSSALSAAGQITGGANQRHHHDYSFTTSNGPGSSAAFSIAQPYIACNYILRII